MTQTDKSKHSSKEERPFIKVYLSDIIRALKKFWLICIALAVLLASVSVVKEKLNYVPKYTASTTVVVSTQSATSSAAGISVYSFYYDTSTAQTLTEIFPFILSSNLLQDAVCADLDIENIPVKLDASSSPGSNMFTLTATGYDPQITYDVLVAAIENYPDVAKYVVGNIQLKIITAPQVPTSPSNSADYVSVGIKGGAIGLIFGFAFVIVYIIQRKTIKTKSDIKSELGLDVLAVVPKDGKKRRSAKYNTKHLISDSSSSGAFCESFRILRNYILSSLKANEKVIMVTSSVPGEGKTTVTANLAISLADSSKKILLIDGDIRHPSIAASLDINSDMLHFHTVTDKYKIAFVNEYKFDVVFPSGVGENQYFDSSDFAKMIFENKGNYDYILIDTPPCGLVSDAMFTAQASDAAVYVVYQDSVRASRIRSSIDSLMSTDVNILGCVLNGAERGISGYGGGYGYGSGYGYGYGYGYEYGYGSKKKHKRTQSYNRSDDSSDNTEDDERFTL